MTAKHPITRTRPGFQVFTPPVPSAGNTIYSNPNVRIMACQQLDQWTLSNRRFPGAPPHFDESGPGFFYRDWPEPNDPHWAGFAEINARLVARRIAEAFEYQGFVRGTGSGPTPDYEGSVCVIGIGDSAQFQPYTGVPTLMSYAMDAVGGPTSSSDLTGAQGGNCWYNAKGVEAVKLWVREFLGILKDELDNPEGGEPLCYPSHFAFDLEYDVPLVWYAINQVRHVFDPEPPITAPYVDYLTKPGWWAWAIDGVNEPRFATEDLLDPEQTAQTTLSEIVSGAPTPNSAFAWYDSQNQAFSSWFTGLTTSIVSYAMARAIYSEVTDENAFPESVCSNYGTYLADSRPRWNRGPNAWMESTVAYLNGDSQAPDLYAGATNRKVTTESDQTYYRRFILQAVQAIAYSSKRLPLTPWVQAPGEVVASTYPPTPGDFRWLLRVLARHGVSEFLIFGATLDTTGDVTNLSTLIARHCASVYPGRNPRPAWFWRA